MSAAGGIVRESQQATEGRDMTLVSVDLGMTEERIQELEQPVTDEQFNWLEERGLLDNGKTYEENVREWKATEGKTMEYTTIYATEVGSDAFKLAQALGRASLIRSVDIGKGTYEVSVRTVDAGKAVAVRDKLDIPQH